MRRIGRDLEVNAQALYWHFQNKDDLCQAVGVDYDTIKEAAAADKRIGRSHLEIFHKGFRGYGGKCLPKDTRALIQLGEKLGVEMALLKRVEELNNALVAAGQTEPKKDETTQKVLQRQGA